LPNKNKSATVAQISKFGQLNTGLVGWEEHGVDSI